MAKSNNPTITVELASPTPKETTTPTVTTSDNKPVEQLIIPVRPALVTVANLVTTTTAAAAASGTAGLAILAGTAMTGAAVARHHHNQRRQRENTQKTRRLGGLSRGSGGLGGLGLGGFGRTNKPGHGKSAGSRKHLNPLGGLGSALKRAISSPHGGHPSRAGRQHGVGTPAGTRGQHGGVSRRRHPSHLGGSRTPHGALGALRHPAIQLARKAVPVARAIGKATLLGLGGLGWFIHHVYQWLRRLTWYLRHLLKPHEDEANPEENDTPHVSDTVDEPDDNEQQPDENRPKVPKPGRAPAMPGTSGLNANDHQGTSPFFLIIKAACDQIAGIQHKGNLTTRAEAYDMAAALAMIGQVIGIRAASYRKESLDPTFVDLYIKAEEALYAIANQLLPLGSYFDALHPERVRDLLAGNNPSAWDTTNNQTIG